MSKICIIGCGFVGLTVAASLAKAGHKIVCVDKDAERRKMLLFEDVPFYEPGLAEALRAYRTNILISDGIIDDADVYVVCVGTPSAKNGSLDCGGVELVVAEVAASTSSPFILIKSTMQPGATRKIHEKLKVERPNVRLCLWPETLREGSALSDLFHASVHLGVADTQDEWEFELANLFRHVFGLMVSSVRSFESVETYKLALNGYLAMRVGYINEIAGVCLRTGADIRDVQELMSTDLRVGGKLLAGPGWGGSCFGKDVLALSVAAGLGSAIGIVDAIAESNRERKIDVRNAIRNDAGSKVAVWGCAFKENTSDLRDSPAIEFLISTKAGVSVYDPYSLVGVREILGDKLRYAVDYAISDVDACLDADVLVMFNDIHGSREKTLERLTHAVLVMAEKPTLIDPRNLVTREEAENLGFTYVQV